MYCGEITLDKGRRAVAMIACGISLAQIASELHCSVKMVSTAVLHIRKRNNAKSKAQLLYMFGAMDLLPEDQDACDRYAEAIREREAAAENMSVNEDPDMAAITDCHSTQTP